MYEGLSILIVLVVIFLIVYMIVFFFLPFFVLRIRNEMILMNKQVARLIKILSLEPDKSKTKPELKEPESPAKKIKKMMD